MIEYHPSKACELHCLSGSIAANVGDRFTEKGKEWEIIAFGKDPEEGEPGVFCKPVNGRLPSYWRQWERQDGSVEWCGDSVAAQLLTKTDGKPRSARGDLLRAAGQGE